MGLLNAFKQYVRDAMPGGALNPEWTPDRVKTLGGLLDLVPVVGGIKGVAESVEDGDVPGVAMNAASIPLDLASPMAKFGLLGMYKLKDFEKARGLLEEADRVYKATGEVPRQKALNIAEMTQKEFDELNKARIAYGQPPLDSRVVRYNARHHYKSRGPTLEGNDYLVDDMMDQLNSVTSGPLQVKTDHPKGPSLMNMRTRIDPYGKAINDRAVFSTDSYSVGKPELFSIVPEGDGLEKGKKLKK